MVESPFPLAWGNITLLSGSRTPTVANASRLRRVRLKVTFFVKVE